MNSARSRNRIRPALLALMVTPLALIDIASILPAPAYAQDVTGSLQGTIVSPEGTPEADVYVSVAGPHLQGTRSTLSDRRGFFQFLILPESQPPAVRRPEQRVCTFGLGDPASFLAATTAGGDPFHAGGKHWTSRNDPEWQTLAAWVRGERLGHATPPTSQESSGGKVRVLQTNAAGDNVHVIDPVTNRVVGLIEGTARELGLAVMAMPSGAGHDAQLIAPLCPTGMLFVPCLKGISHSEAERATAPDLAAGARVLADALLAMADA